MAEPQHRVIQRLRSLVQGGGELDMAQAGEDMDPGDNLRQLNSTARHRDMSDPRQQAMLQQERSRLEDLQQQMQGRQQQQQFTQRLEQRLNPRIGTPEDSDPQAMQQFQKAQFLAKLMARMKQRYPGMGPQMGPGY